MRARAVLAAVFGLLIVGTALLGPAARIARADSIPPPRLYVTVEATTVGGRLVFLPQTNGAAVIVVPQVPVLLNVTVRNVDPTPGMSHTFTIRSTATNPPTPFIVNTGILDPGEQATVEFLIESVGGVFRIVSGARNETAQVEGSQIRFFCQPHESLNMIGHIVVGGVTQPTEEPSKGVFLRAYWIGLLGIAGTLLLIVISYFVIKSSSRHYVDHHEHIRRGGP